MFTFYLKLFRNFFSPNFTSFVFMVFLLLKNCNFQNVDDSSLMMAYLTNRKNFFNKNINVKLSYYFQKLSEE